MRVLFALSGPVAVGKSQFCSLLQKRFGAVTVSTREILLAAGVENERASLQKAGEQKDRATDGQWVADGLDDVLARSGQVPDVVILDAIRLKQQVDHLRRSYGRKVVHVFLNAADAVLEQRYLERKSSLAELPDYAQLKQSSTEARIRDLAAVADVYVDTSYCEPASAVAQATAGLGLYPLAPDRLVDVVVGGQYGSEGKGHISAHIAPGYDLLMRVGGPNAGHKVYKPQYTYIQLPSGTRSNLQAKILIGPGATIWLPQMQREIADTGLTPDRLFIDPKAMIIEQSDIDREQESMDAIGSTKKGVGVATARKIVGRDGEPHLGAKVRLVEDTKELAAFCASTATELEKAYARRQRICLEGTQGTDLSLHHGPYPMVTSRETTASGCLADAGIAPTRVRKVVMVTRTYPIRVGGNSGPMERKTDFAEIARRSGLSADDLIANEVGSVSGKRRRVAEFDWEQIRRSAQINGTTDIALTFADYLSDENQHARRYEQLTQTTKDFVDRLERVTNARVSLISTRWAARAIIDRRDWA